MSSEITVCYRHPETETSLRCNRCNKYICAKCAQRSPVGFRCPDCMVEIEDRFYSNVKDETLNPFDRALGQPFFTYVLIAINLIVFAALELQGGSTQDDVLIKFGANYGPFILTHNELWRLFTYMFLHIGAQHLAFNTIGLLAFGLESERLYGAAKFLTIYILTGLFGGLASFAISGPMTFSAGASGAIFGIIGTQLAFFAYYRYRLGDFSSQKVQSMLTLIGVSLILGFSGVMPADNWAHLGGLVSGLGLGFLFAPRYAVDHTRTPRRVYDRASFLRRWWVTVLALCLFGAGTWQLYGYWQTHAYTPWYFGGATADFWLGGADALNDPAPQPYIYDEQGQLVGLNFNDIDLNSFTPTDYDLNNITFVNLSENKLQKIPDFVTTLPKLEFLDLSYNDFEQFPLASLQQMPELTGLAMSNNRLRQLPPEIGQLKALSWLDLSNNQIEQIPPELGNLSQLEVLYLSGNRFQNVPESIKNLPLLDETDFDFNSVQTD